MTSLDLLCFAIAIVVFCAPYVFAIVIVLLCISIDCNKTR